jgi:ribonuclease HI
MLNSKVHIYGDGSCRTNPGGVGGWGVVLTTDTGPILHTLTVGML